MKKLFAVLLALSLILTLGVSTFTTVSADEVKTWTGDITIKGSDNVPVAGKTFAAYKLLDAVAVDENDLEAGVIYSIPAALQDFYNDLCNLTDDEGNPVAATGDAVNLYINNLSAEELREFAADALAAAVAAGIQPATVTAGADDTEATFTGLAFGYYVIEDQGAATPISALMLKSTSEDVVLKADKPFITKKIDGNIDQDITTDKTNETPDGLVDYNTAKVGDVVPYVLASKVPDMTGYTSYTFTVTDTFSAGLTFNNDVAITIGGENYTDFTVVQNGQVVTITFNNFINQADKKGEDIVITYSATVNENAVFGEEGNPNKVYLTYSNNPQTDSTEKTDEDIVYTYLVDLIINKTDANGDSLQGAKFDLKDANGNVIASGESDENGLVKFTWVNGVKGLRDGETYTIVETEAPTGYNKAKDITFTVACTDPTNGTPICTWSTNNDKVLFNEVDAFETTIENTTGWLLPETGGIGTTIFTVVGCLLMVGAIVLLVSKKRAGAAA